MTGIIFVTQLVDPDDPVLGFVTGWVRTLAGRFDPVWVIANEVRHDPWTEDPVIQVISLGKEDGRGRGARAMAYTRVLLRLVRRDPAALLAHMCPIYLNLAAPIMKPARVPLLLWFAHPADSPTLRLSERLADAILTSLPGAFPHAGPKVRVIGQAIDLDAFEGTPLPPSVGPLRAVAIGRTSPSKGFLTIVEAVAMARDAGVDLTLRIVGPSTTERERAHRAELERQIVSRGLDAVIKLEPGLPHEAVHKVLGEAHVLLNAMVGGSGDKVVFEAMAMGRLVLVSNPSFADLLSDLPLPSRFPPGDAAALADRIRALWVAPAEVRQCVADALGDRVRLSHSSRHWGAKVAAVTETLPPHPSTR
jgi:glycosyltransferase involved in cell wall biosynthesis